MSQVQRERARQRAYLVQSMQIQSTTGGTPLLPSATQEGGGLRRRARIDANQPEVVKALRKIGAKVAITAQLGNGFPDLAVAYRGKWFLMEVKDGTLSPSARKLSDEERDFHAEFCGHAPVHVVENPEDAIRVVTGGKR